MILYNSVDINTDMSIFSEINTIRKSGNIEEAYDKAKEALSSTPNDAWIKRGMGWVLRDYIVAAVKDNDAEQIANRVQELSELNLQGEDMLTDSVLWAIYEYIKKNSDNLPLLDSAIETIVKVPFHYSPAVNCNLSVLSKNAENLKNYGKFAQWWQYDKFSENDYVEQEYEGKRMQSAAEKAYNAYAKWLCKNGDEEVVELFLPQMAEFCRKHKSRFSVYFLAQLYIKAGDKKNALRVFIPFARKQANMFWVWELIVSMFDEPSDKVKYICQALKCGGKEELLINLKVAAAKIFMASGYYDEAKSELDSSVRVRNANNWRIPDSISAMQREKWYQQAKAKSDMKAFYAKMSVGADKLLLSDVKVIRVIATFINKEKNFVSFKTQEGVKGFAKFKNLEGINKGTNIDISVEKIAEQGPTHIIKYRIIDNL